jgi:hypothetical protein
MPWDLQEERSAAMEDLPNDSLKEVVTNGESMRSRRCG